MIRHEIQSTPSLVFSLEWWKSYRRRDNNRRVKAHFYGPAAAKRMQYRTNNKNGMESMEWWISEFIGWAAANEMSTSAAALQVHFAFNNFFPILISTFIYLKWFFSMNCSCGTENTLVTKWNGIYFRNLLIHLVFVLMHVIPENSRCYSCIHF